MKNLTRITPVLVAGALGIAACGGSDGASLSGEDAELATALASVWEADDTFPAEVPTDCVAEGFISGVGGAEGAEGYGVNADNVGEDSFDENPLSEEDALAVGDAVFDCDGFKTWFVSNFAGDVDTEQVECLAGELSDEPIQALFASNFMDDEDASAIEEQHENTFESELFDGFGTCEFE